VASSLLLRNDRRIDAETYLATGYGVRLAIESKPGGWGRFGDIAAISAPPRIKMVLVSPEHGVPYLNTSQVFEIRPTPRKWLAFGKTSKAESRLALQGTILVMASASPGRSTVTTKAHEGAVISHHFMRISPKDPALGGWVYAFLKSPQGAAMMKGSQYASIIRHIEPHHLAAIPIPEVCPDVAADFASRLRSIVDLRNDAHRLAVEAEARFTEAIGATEPNAGKESFTVRASQLSAAVGDWRRPIIPRKPRPSSSDPVASSC